MDKVPTEAVRRQIIALIPVYMNVLIMGCGNGWISNAVYFLMEGNEDIQPTYSECALIASFSELGRLVFAIPAGILTDKYGRKKIIICAAFLHFITWMALSLDTSLIILYVGRLIVGVATSLINSTALPSIGEIASPKIRGQLTNNYSIFMNLGLILPPIISVIFSSYKSLTWSITIFSIASLLSMLWVSETPNFLVSVSQLEQAKNNLRCFRQGYPENDIDVEFENLKKYIEEEKSRKSELSWLKFLKTKSIRRPLLIGILLNFFSMSTGAILLKNYIIVIFPSNQFVPKIYYPLLGNLIALLIAFSAHFYIEKFPRRTIFLFGAASMTITHAICAFANYFYVENQLGFVFKWVFLLGNILLMVYFDASIQPMNSAVKSELYPQAVKGFCGSLAVIGQSSATILSYQLYNLMRDYFHVCFIYVIFSINSFILCLIIYFLLPESRGTTLVDLQMKFKKKSHSGNSNVESRGNNS